MAKTQTPADEIDASTLLQGKVALVTGGGRGIGRAVAELFARAGATVLLSARSIDEVTASAAEITALGAGMGWGLAGDVGAASFWDAVSAKISELGGRWDILVNCAGASGPVGPLSRMGVDDLDTVIRTNLTGSMLGCRTAVPFMRSGQGGVIINVSSGLAKRRVQPGLAAYSATKAALIRLSEVLAAELEQDGIDVFALHPGIVETRMSLSHISETENQSGSVGERLKTIQMLTVEESAAAFLVLAAGLSKARSGDFVQFDDADIVAQGRLYLSRLIASV